MQCVVEVRAAAKLTAKTGLIDFVLEAVPSAGEPPTGRRPSLAIAQPVNYMRYADCGDAFGTK